MARRTVTIALTGVKSLDRKLKEIASEEGAKGINAVFRKATREAVKQYVRPNVMAGIAVDTGALKKQVKVRAIKRTRRKVGSQCGFRDPLFTGDTFYAGFQEFGWTDRSGSKVPGDRVLRSALYDNERKIRSFVRAKAAAWVRSRNR